MVPYCDPRFVSRFIQKKKLQNNSQNKTKTTSLLGNLHGYCDAIIVWAFRHIINETVAGFTFQSQHQVRLIDGIVIQITTTEKIGPKNQMASSSKKYKLLVKKLKVD